ncbi:glycosyltransferase family 25 protein [Aquariibacter albus]|uniref:Glycosyltransferase family 25 protein n=1 Tax=Aquariibacter albus TaxID=2759899 RepID=A0A839HHX6_9BURK|nr:glycosyltransferase family 25 protein [Aquariibacter albus]MBB1161835.1 glycosyltransferase family 25 protein [Aquariibacter albus]
MTSDLFDRIVVINLPDRADRRREIDAQLQRIDLRLGQGVVKLFAAVRPDDAGDFPSRGARGCFLSHLGVLREAREAGVRRLLILEDDCDWVRGLDAATWRTAWSSAEGMGWDIAYGGHQALHLPPVADRWQAVDSRAPVQTTHCLAFSARGIERAVVHLETMMARKPGDPRGGPMHVDGAYTWLRTDHPDLRTVAAVPPLADQRPSRTDIHDLRWFDLTPGVRTLVSLLRRLRHRLRR